MSALYHEIVDVLFHRKLIFHQERDRPNESIKK